MRRRKIWRMQSDEEEQNPHISLFSREEARMGRNKDSLVTTLALCPSTS